MVDVHVEADRRIIHISVDKVPRKYCSLQRLHTVEHQTIIIYSVNYDRRRNQTEKYYEEMLLQDLAKFPCPFCFVILRMRNTCEDIDDQQNMINYSITSGFLVIKIVFYREITRRRRSHLKELYRISYILFPVSSKTFIVRHSSSVMSYETQVS